MNTRNEGERPRRWLIAIFISTFLFNVNGAHAEDLEIRNAQNDVKPVIEKRIDDIKETEKCIQRNAEEERREKERQERIKRAKMKRLAEARKWESLGQCRITYYCPSCNDPAGSYQSSSGVTLYEGCVACNWLSIGTKIKIHGVEYTVMDTCGTDAIDIFIDTGGCQCSGNYYTEVKIRKE